MKISAAIPLLDLAAPAPAPSADDGAAGRGFENAVRAVEARAGDGGGAPAGTPAKPAHERERVAENKKPADPARPTASNKDEEKATQDEAMPNDAAAASNTPTADLLGRLLAGTGLAVAGKAVAGQAAKGAEGEAAADGLPALKLLSGDDAKALAAAASAIEEGTTFDGALEERLVITPLGAGSAEGKAKGGAKDRTGVGLEVLHMETHFEPRVDDVVLVEGAGKPVAGAVSADTLGGVLSTIRSTAAKTAQASERIGEPGLSMRFDETLARLASGEGAADADTSGERGAKGRRTDAKGSDDGRLGAARSRVETTVEVESQLAAPAPGSMTSQIADRIVDAFRPSSGQERMADTAPGTTHLRMTAGGAALKTLTIQLQPENLGKLEVSMRLVEGRLTLELAASSAETATALAHDRAGLKKLLEHAGFSMDEASITIVARDSTASTAKPGAGQDAGGQGQQAPGGNGRGGSDGAADGGRGSARDTGSQARDPSPGRGGRGEAEAEPAVRKRTSVFL